MTLRVGSSASKGNGPVEAFSEQAETYREHRGCIRRSPGCRAHVESPWSRPGCTVFGLTLSLCKIREYFAPVCKG